MGKSKKKHKHSLLLKLLSKNKNCNTTKKLHNISYWTFHGKSYFSQFRKFALNIFTFHSKVKMKLVMNEFPNRSSFKIRNSSLKQTMGISVGSSPIPGKSFIKIWKFLKNLSKSLPELQLFEQWELLIWSIFPPAELGQLPYFHNKHRASKYPGLLKVPHCFLLR